MTIKKMAHFSDMKNVPRWQSTLGGTGSLIRQKVSACEIAKIK